MRVLGERTGTNSSILTIVLDQEGMFEQAEVVLVNSIGQQIGFSEFCKKSGCVGPGGKGELGGHTVLLSASPCSVCIV